MFRPSESERRKPALTLACEWLDANIPQLAEAITTRTFAANPELQTKYGNRGRLKCEQDAIYHLHYLYEAMASDSVTMFVDYIGWAKIMLCSRSIEWADLKENLEAMIHALRLAAPRKFANVFLKFIKAALKQLPELAEKLPSFIDPARPFAELAESYLHSLLVLNREEAVSLVLRKVDSGLAINDLFRYVIHPVQQEVGRLWQENKITVLQEHYCTAATDVLITRLKRRFVGVPRAVTALSLCPDGEEHSLAIKMFSDLLEADGWKVAFIGPKCPIADVLKHVRRHATDLIAISVATPLNLSKAKQLITEIKKLPAEDKPAIILGGAAINTKADSWDHLGADAVASDISEGVEIANRLIAQRERGERTRSAKTPVRV